MHWLCKLSPALHLIIGHYKESTAVRFVEPLSLLVYGWRRPLEPVLVLVSLIKQEMWRLFLTCNSPKNSFCYATLHRCSDKVWNELWGLSHQPSFDRFRSFPGKICFSSTKKKNHTVLFLDHVHKHNLSCSHLNGQTMMGLSFSMEHTNKWLSKLTNSL